MNAGIELRHLRAFVAVAEELHFGRAALSLGVAQPALSRQVRQLEGLMQVPLFRRTSRHVELSPAGASLLPRAREMLSRLVADVDEARRVARGESGRLDVAFVSSAAALVGAAARSILSSTPDVHVQLHEGFTSAVLDRLSRGDAGVGIVRDAEPADGLTLTTIDHEPFLAVLPASHPLAPEEGVTARQLVASPLVLFPAQAGTLALTRTLRPFHEIGLSPRVAIEGSQWGTIGQLVASGLGVTVAPASVTAQLPPGVVVRPLDSTEARSELQVAHRTDHDDPLVAAFASVVATGVSRSVERG